jgi:hypothetical protein
MSVVPMGLAQMVTGGKAAGDLVALPIVDPEAEYQVGLIAAPRDPLTPMVQALFDMAGRLRKI